MKRRVFFVLLTVIQFVFPKLNFAQAPDLGTTSTFSIFTATGAIDILGSSTIMGDVGTNFGAYFKSPSSTIFGNVNNTNSTSAMAAADVATAYNDLVGRTCGLTIAGLGTLRETLGPDTVFCLNGAQTLDGDLTLDGQNDPSSIFIIKIDGALSTTASSRVLLINSASFCNVFWQVNGMVELEISSTFSGTIVANGAISLLNNAVLNGRALSQVGAISLSNNSVTGCDASGTPLPVVLTSFTAEILEGNVLLNWATASEINNDYFIVQRSKDGIIIEDILRVNGSGNSFIVSQYSAIDYQPFDGISYYRLKQIDIDGTIDYSDFVSLNFKKTGDIKISPNPFNTSTTITIPEISNLVECEIRVYNVLGEEVIRKSIKELVTTLEADKLLSGIYLCLITSNQEIIHADRILLNR